MAAEGDGRFDREFGGRRHFAAVRLRIEPTAGDEHGDSTFRCTLPEGTVRSLYLTAIETGAKDGAGSGPLLGYPVINWRAVLLEAEEHASDSSEIAFETAARMAFTAAAEAGQPVLMEPIMSLEIRTPDEYFGAINGDLNSRRAAITDSDARGGYRVITAEAPLAELFGYTTHLRSLSQGRATASMEPLRYAPVPAAVAARFLQ